MSAFSSGGSKSTDHLCPVCEKRAYLRCSACRRVWYCSKDHQAVDWRSGHRQQCKPKGNSKPKPTNESSPKIGCVTEEDLRRAIFENDNRTAPQSNLHAKGECKKISNALKRQKEKLAKNPDVDYVLIGKNMMDYGVVLENGLGKLLFHVMRQKAEQKNERGIGMMFQMLKDSADKALYQDYGLEELKKQLEQEYGVKVDWSKY